MHCILCNLLCEIMYCVLSCWMAWEPSLGAFYGPVAFIIFVDCMYFLSILLQLRRHPERRFELKEQPEEQQRLSVTEIAGSLSAHADASGPISLSALENEHTFLAQLVGVAGALALYTLLWLFGALTVSQEHPLNLAFSCLFGVIALALGAFLVGHHCGTRQDMRRHWAQACCLGHQRYAMQVDALLAPITGTSGDGSTNTGNNEGARCHTSGTESSCTNKSAPSVRNSTQGCKLTNLQVEAAQCKSVPAQTNGPTVLDNSLTEHSLDNEIKMHVSPVEVQYRPNISSSGHPVMGSANGNINGHLGRHHKNRARVHRASRLTVLREYAYDVPTSVEGSEHSAPQRRHHHESLHARNSRRAAYLAYRERQQSQLQQDSSDASASLPRRPRQFDRCTSKGTGASVGNERFRNSRLRNSLGSGLGSGTINSQSNGVGNECVVGEQAETEMSSSVKDCPKQPLPVQLEVQPKSYGLNLASENGLTKSSERQQNLSPLNTDSSATIKTGLWKHETTV